MEWPIAWESTLCDIMTEKVLHRTQEKKQFASTTVNASSFPSFIELCLSINVLERERSHFTFILSQASLSKCPGILSPFRLLLHSRSHITVESGKLAEKLVTIRVKIDSNLNESDTLRASINFHCRFFSSDSCE